MACKIHRPPRSHSISVDVSSISAAKLGKLPLFMGKECTSINCISIVRLGVYILTKFKNLRPSKNINIQKS